MRYYNSGTLENVKEMKIPWLFESELKGEEVVIKFSRTYYGEVHRHLADQGLAPKLHMCKKLCGGWYDIVMAKTESSRLQLNVTKPVKEALKYAIDTMHKEDYVHGDVQLQNILVVRIYIYDFDWAGKKNSVRFVFVCILQMTGQLGKLQLQNCPFLVLLQFSLIEQTVIQTIIKSVL